MTTYSKLEPLDYSVIEGVRHWPCADGNVWVGVNTFSSRENLLADWLDKMKQERDNALMKIANHSELPDGVRHKPDCALAALVRAINGGAS